MRWRYRARVRHVVAALEAHGYRINAVPTPGPGTAAEVARRSIEAGADLILALGGDGTLNEVAAGVIGTQVPLGTLPAGTANVLGSVIRPSCATGPSDPATG